MKIIFLDIDGVLNSYRSAIVYNTYSILDPIAVGILHQLCHETDAKVVISSTWRMNNSLENIAETLDAAFNVDWNSFIVGSTPVIPKESRGFEIDTWLQDHPEVKHYVILDDDGDMLDNQPFVQCSIEVGLSQPNFEQAKNILNTKSYEERLKANADTVTE